jgi:hypothetical protein
MPYDLYRLLFSRPLAIHQILQSKFLVELKAQSWLIRKLNISVLDDLAIVNDEIPFASPVSVLEIERLVAQKILNGGRAVSGRDRGDRPQNVMGSNGIIVSSRQIGNSLGLKQAAGLGNIDLDDMHRLIGDKRQEIAAGVKVLSCEDRRR